MFICKFGDKQNETNTSEAKRSQQVFKFFEKLLYKAAIQPRKELCGRADCPQQEDNKKHKQKEKRVSNLNYR